MIFYGIDRVKGSSFINGYHVPYVYLHGDLENLNNYDLVELPTESNYDDLKAFDECIMNVNVLLSNCEYKEAKLFLWKTTNGIHHHIGLIVDINDEEAINHAKEAYDKKVVSI